MLKRGDVYYADLPVSKNSSIQAGVRPVIITSNEMALKHSPVVQYIPLTSRMYKMRLPVQVALDNDFLKEPSVALVEQEGLIDKSRLKQKIGTLSKKDMLKIDLAIINQRGMTVDDLMEIITSMKQTNKRYAIA